MCLRYVLHPFTEGSWASWAQIALNCILFNLPFLPPLVLSFLQSHPGSDLIPTTCLKVCFGEHFKPDNVSKNQRIESQVMPTGTLGSGGRPYPWSWGSSCSILVHGQNISYCRVGYMGVWETLEIGLHWRRVGEASTESQSHTRKYCTHQAHQRQQAGTQFPWIPEHPQRWVEDNY